MGFTRPQAAKALNATDGNVERAVDWIFSHADSLDAVESPAAAAPDRTLGCRDGPESKSFVQQSTQVYYKLKTYIFR